MTPPSPTKSLLKYVVSDIGLSMKNRVALITGGASGIGRAIVSQFSSQGIQTIIADFNSEAELVAKEYGSLFLQVDLSNQSDCKSLVEKSLAELGRVDYLINNAGFQVVSPIENFPEESWNKIISVLLTAPFLLTKYVWPQMKERKFGRIVNIASIHSLVASPFKAAYVSAKHGLMGLTKTAALEGGEFGITVNSICPAYVRTPLVDRQIQSQAENLKISVEDVIQKVMLEPASIKRLIEPEEVASLTSYLCSDAASSITGAAITMDLGWTSR